MAVVTNVGKDGKGQVTHGAATVGTHILDAKVPGRLTGTLLARKARKSEARRHQGSPFRKALPGTD